MAEPVVESPGEGRRVWLSVLARARSAEVVAAWEALEARPGYQALRPPETGLVLVRGRMGGLGDAFNLGEMTVTRAAVRLESGETGVSYVAGRERRHAEIAAAVDAMMQSEVLRARVAEPVVGKLRRAQDERRALAARKAAATTVDFFTMVTGRGGA